MSRSKEPPPGEGEPAPALLRSGLQELGRSLADGQFDRLLRLAALLERWGARLNLSGHRGPAAIVRGLLLESIALEGVLPEAPKLVDLGSGAGIPGLPVALLRPRTRVLLVEARRRRHHFQRAAIRELELGNAEARLGRAEDLAPEPSPAVLAQALARPDQALAWMLPWAEPGGLLLLPAAPTATPEARPDLRLEGRLPYRAPGGPPRVLLVARRLA
jgi:16S rRNA (guanine527-N7)-methyltransferase